MINEMKLSRSIRLLCLGGMTLGMHAAVAQEAATGAGPQKIEVTGSRIPSLSVDGPAPVTVLSAKDIKIDGARNVEDLLNNLPQVFADQGAAVSNGATGTATVSLRGLGADRTLVLVNSKRLPAGSVSSSAADLNEIPSALIKRVDVLTGGAGAVYGAGAIAGVVNFILKDNFEGVEVQLNHSGYNHQQHSDVADVVRNAGYPVPGDATYDGKQKDANILIGGNFDGGKGNATVFFTYKEAAPLTESMRDFTACSLNLKSDTAFGCGGSSTNATSRVTVNSGPLKGSSFTNTADGVTPYTGAAAYNYGPVNYMQRPSKTYGFNAQAHYDINDQVRVYQEFNFHNYSTDAQIAEGGVFYATPATLSYDNPLLSAAWKSSLGLTAPGQTVNVLLGKRNVEGGPRVSSITDQSFRELIGVKGEINNWTYDAFAQFARVTHSESANGYFSAAKIDKALDVTADANGNAVCASYANGTDLNCVPYNLYKVGGVNKAQLDYLQVSGQTGGYTQQIIYGGSIGSDLGVYGIKTPWSTNGVGVSLGVEHRAEKLVYSPDQENITGDLSGSGGTSPPLTGTYSVKEVFGEVHVPLLQKMPFAESLELSGSYRHSKYSTENSANTYGAGIDWAPIKQLRVRGSYQRAVRAPTIGDLYAAQSVGLGGSSDPCAGTAKDLAEAKITQEMCARSGVTAAQFGHIDSNSAGQYNTLGGGNSQLNPEIGDTYTFGFVLTPVKELTVTIDAFKIDIKNTISAIDSTSILNQCLAKGDPVVCSYIHRDSDGSLWLSNDGYTKTITSNIGTVGTSGIDLGANYRLRMGGWGGLEFTMNGTWLRSLTTENIPGMGEYDCKGLFGLTCGTPNPEWRHKFRTTWSTPWNMDVSATWRHFGAVRNDMSSSNELLAAPDSLASIDSRFGARDYFDLNANYDINKHVSLSGGVNNLFDRDPPVASASGIPSAGASNGNTFPQVYDAYGRKLYINLTARF